MKRFGLTDQQYKLVEKTIVEPWEKKGATIYCYGSRARGDHKEFSDLDLMVESPKDLTTEISRAQENISNSHFPYKVDIVQLSEFAESYKPGYEKDKVLFRQLSILSD